MTTHLVTMGGGGFSMSDDGSATNLDRYLLELTGRNAPLVCFVPTAAADEAGYIRKFLNAYAALGVRTMVLTLWQDAAASVSRLRHADLVLIGGGSTVNLLALWRAHGVDKVLRQMIEADDQAVIAGLSAGGNCWYQGCLTDSFGDLRVLPDGLGVLPGSFCAHWDGEPGRQSLYADAVASGALPDGHAADDGAALHWVDGRLHGAIAQQPGQHVYRVAASNEPTTGGVVVEMLRTEVL